MKTIQTNNTIEVSKKGNNYLYRCSIDGMVINIETDTIYKTETMKEKVQNMTKRNVELNFIFHDSIIDTSLFK
jgi:hypothetical protein